MLLIIKADDIFQDIQYFIQIFIFQKFDCISFGRRDICLIINRGIIVSFEGSEYFSGSSIGKDQFSHYPTVGVMSIYHLYMDV